MRARSHCAALLAVVASLAATGFVRPAAEDLPNLRPQAPYGVELGLDDSRSQRALRFNTTTWNLSDHHLDLAGVPTSDPDVAEASQCVDFEGRACLSRRTVGQFVFHPEHAHFHFDDYATYELRRVRPDGTPDFSATGLVATGGKVSFCLMDTDRRADGHFTDLFGWYLVCQTGYQGISAWWGDTYGSGLAGQQIVVEGIAPGAYAIVIHVNPSGILAETDHDDNVAWTAITLGDDSVVVDRTHQDVPVGIQVRQPVIGA